MPGEVGIEKRIITAAAVFAIALSGVIAMTVKLLGIGLPTCLTDVRPFREPKVIQQGPNRYEIHYVARMWRFEPADISLLPGSTADIYLSTADVTHGLEIAGTNVNIMAVPGAVNYARVKFDKPGDYLVVCNEYCGIAHQRMAGRIHVTEKAATAVAPAATAPVQQLTGGRKYLDDYGCLACHSLDGSPGAGPTLKGLYHSHVQLTSGATVVAEDEYLRESIVKPEAKVVKGFDPIMPAAPIPDAEVKAMVEYIETLR